jgi:hypothetical protein
MCGVKYVLRRARQSTAGSANCTRPAAGSTEGWCAALRSWQTVGAAILLHPFAWPRTWGAAQLDPRGQKAPRSEHPAPGLLSFQTLSPPSQHRNPTALLHMQARRSPAACCLSNPLSVFSAAAGLASYNTQQSPADLMDWTECTEVKIRTMQPVWKQWPTAARLGFRAWPLLPPGSYTAQRHHKQLCAPPPPPPPE